MSGFVLCCCRFATSSLSFVCTNCAEINLDCIAIVLFCIPTIDHLYNLKQLLQKYKDGDRE